MKIADYVDHYDIRLPFLAANDNHNHDDSRPEGAPFRVVGPVSPRPWRDAVEGLAYYFRRETGYDFPPYTASELDWNWDLAKDRVLVFAKETVLTDWVEAVYFFGAVGVRWRDWRDAPASWSIAWAWLHPYERRKGHLTKAWPFILKMFPSPHVEPPLSQAMIGFLKKVGYESHLRPPSACSWEIQRRTLNAGDYLRKTRFWYTSFTSLGPKPRKIVTASLVTRSNPAGRLKPCVWFLNQCGCNDRALGNWHSFIVLSTSKISGRSGCVEAM